MFDVDGPGVDVRTGLRGSSAGRPGGQAGAADELEDGIAAVAKALAHPARVHIVRLLLKKQSCIGCDIVDEVGLAQSTVSEHLRILKAAGVITGEIERPRVCYSLNADSLLPLATLLNAMFEPKGNATALPRRSSAGRQRSKRTVR